MGAFKTAVLNTEDLQALRDDLSKQLTVRGREAPVNLVPEGPLQRKLQEIAAGTSEQRSSALKNALRKGAVMGTGGMLATGLFQGAQEAPMGLVMGVPSAMRGYSEGKQLQQKKEIEDILNQINI